MIQATSEHPLVKYGYKRPPHWLWRLSPRIYIAVAAVEDVWLIVTGRLSIHRAWQEGYDRGHLMELERQLRGGG